MVDADLISTAAVQENYNFFWRTFVSANIGTDTLDHKVSHGVELVIGIFKYFGARVNIWEGWIIGRTCWEKRAIVNLGSIKCQQHCLR